MCENKTTLCPPRCICGLLKNKPRILVTHQLQYLKAADQIVVLKEVGASAACNTVQTLIFPTVFKCLFILNVGTCLFVSGSHGGEGNVHRAAAVWRGLHLPAEERGRRGAAAAAASSRQLHQDQDSVPEFCALSDLLCPLGQRRRPFTG